MSKKAIYKVITGSGDDMKVIETFDTMEEAETLMRASVFDGLVYDGKSLPLSEVSVQRELIEG